jgi:hypothetical protein
MSSSPAQIKSLRCVLRERPEAKASDHLISLMTGETVTRFYRITVGKGSI